MKKDRCEEQKSIEESKAKAHELIDKSTNFVLVALDNTKKDLIVSTIAITGDMKKVMAIDHGIDQAKMHIRKTVVMSFLEKMKSDFGNPFDSPGGPFGV